MIFPSTEDDPDPLKGKGAHGGVMPLPACPVLPVVRLGPTGMPDRLPGEFVERLSEE
jgi:hypothetical protein